MPLRPRKRLPTALEMESGAPNGLPIALEMEFGPPNRLPITLEMEFAPPNGLPIALEMEFAPPNGLPITLEMEFARPATISNVFQTPFCLPARTLQHMKSPRFEESRATFTNKTYFGRFASAFISLFCDGLYFATIVTPCGFISLYCITWNIYLIIIGIPTSTYRERSCS